MPRTDDMAQAVQHDDSIAVTAESETEGAPALKIAGVDPELGFAGGEMQVLGLTLALAKARSTAELICDPAGRLWQRATATGIKCHPLRVRNAIDFAAGIKLRAVLRREQYDIVHFHTSRAHSLAPFARGFARALIVTRRMDYRPNRMFAPYLYNRAVDSVIAISDGVAKSLAGAGVDRSRVTIVHSGVDCGSFRPPTPDERAAARAAFGIGADDVLVASVGALEERKGHRYLIDAIAPIANVKCLIAGAGSLRGELENKIVQQRCAGRIRLLGRSEDPRQLLWASDIFAMPSLNEGLGVAALEAMSSALPVVATDVGGLREALEPNRSGILVPPANAAMLAEAIEWLAKSDELRSRMGALARARVVEHYSIETMAARTLRIYRDCIKRKMGKGAIV
jgi:L-malate glycosyltransferase